MCNSPDITYALQNYSSKNKVKRDCAISYLIAKFQPLINKISQQIFKNIDTHNILQDIYQSGNLGILIAIQSYNHKSSFNSWCYIQIRYQLQQTRDTMFPVKVSRYLVKKGYKTDFIHINDNEGDDLDNQPNPQDHLIQTEDRELITQALRLINKIFTNKECHIFRSYYFLNIPLNKLSKKHNVNANAIIRKMILKIRELKENHELL